LHLALTVRHNMFDLIKRHSSKSSRTQCQQTFRERKIVFCDWGFHARASKDGWCFTYVDDVDFDPLEDLGCYKRVDPDNCGETVSQFVTSQLRKNSRIKGCNGWRFVCLIEDGTQRAVPVRRRDKTPRTMLLFEREAPCPCRGREHPLHRSEYSKASDDKRSSFSAEYETATPPPQYRSRVSTLATLHEHDTI